MNVPQVSNNNPAGQTKNVDHKVVHHGALVSTSKTVSKNTSKEKTKRRKLRPQRDIGNETSRASRGAAGAEKGGLFSTWTGDALSLFMFNVAPLILQINFKIRETMANAQLTEAQNQVTAAQESAVLKRQQGQADAQRMHLDACSSFAGAGSGIAGAIQGGFESFGANSVMEDEQAMQNKMLSDLSGSTPKTESDNPQARGEVRAEGQEELPGEETSAEEQRAQRQQNLEEQKAKARRSGAKLKEKFEAREEEMRAEEKSKFRKARDWFGKDKVLGLGKSKELIDHEHDIRVGKKASSAAHDDLFTEGTDHYDAEYQRSLVDVTKDPEVAAEFMKSLGTPEEQVNALRGMPEDVRANVLRSYAKSEEAAALKAHLNTNRKSVANLASFERDKLNHSASMRQGYVQAINSLSSGTTQIRQQDEILESAQKDSYARLFDTEASIMGQVRGTQDATINSALDQVRGFMDWYAQMQSQVIGAVTQSMA